MAYCTNCGNKLREGAKFCDSCGYQVASNDTDSKRQTVFEGNIHKCPNCGEIIDAFTTTCPSCNFEIRGVNATSSVKELALKLADCETSEQKIDLIKNFYIPNTKEDIYEFFILATSNIENGDDDIEAWSAKLEQAYQKAKLSFKGTSEFQELSTIYKKTKKKKKFKTIGRTFKKSRILKSLLIGMIGIILLIVSEVGDRLSGGTVQIFHILNMVAIFPIMGAVFYAMSDGESLYEKSQKKDKNDKKK